jgi:predicted amidohydrolase
MPEPMTLRVAAVQMDVKFGDLEANLQRVEAFARCAALQGAELAVFPECSLTGYCFETRAEAMAKAVLFSADLVERLCEIARQTRCFLVVGAAEADGKALYNTCVLVGPDRLLGKYRKSHLPYLGLDRFAAPGDEAYCVYSVGPARVGMNICYDASFPEPARVLTLLGADLIVLPTNWPPAAEAVAEHVIPTRALENNIYFVAANRIGSERGFSFIGRSVICGPDGSVLVRAPAGEEAILVADVDVHQARQKHLVRVPGRHEIDRVADRRPELYQPIVRATAPRTAIVREE